MASEDVSRYREELAAAIIDGDDLISVVNFLLAAKVPLRDKYRVIDFRILLEHNSETSDSLKLLIAALELLERYGKNLLKPERDRPETWRLIKHSNTNFRKYVMTMKDGLHILHLMGYTESTLDGMVFPDNEKPDYLETLHLVTDIVLAQKEIQAYMADCHPNPSAIELYLSAKILEEKKDSKSESQTMKKKSAEQSKSSCTTPPGNVKKSSDEMNVMWTQAIATENKSFKNEAAALTTHSTSDETFKEEVRKCLLEYEVEFGSDEIDETEITGPSNKSKLDVKTRFGHLPIFKQPVQLIFSNEHNVLTINDDVIGQIASIDTPLNIVGICGHYRTGKSYLMNLLANERTGFSLGSTVASHTKGIWAWCKPHPKQKDQVLLLLDTEGLSDVKKGDVDHDNKLFCLATVLSSTMIYNHHGVLDQNAIEKLSSQMTKTIRMADKDDLSDDENDQIIRIVTPTFILCLRDFFLEIKEGDKTITADEYFESVLQISTEAGQETNNTTKECIRKFFPARKCFTISTPASSRNLPKLEKLETKDLDQYFVSEVESLKEYVYGCKAKVLDHVTTKAADGLVFDSFTRTYVRAMGTGDSFSFVKAFKQASVYTNSKLTVMLTNQYKQEVEAIKLPVPKKQELQDRCMDIQKMKMREFRKQSYPQRKEFWEDQAMRKMEVIQKEKMAENVEKVQSYLGRILASLHDEIIQSNKAKYEQLHGLLYYKQDVETVAMTFLQKTKEFDPDEQSAAVIAYKKSIKEEKIRIEFAAKLQEEQRKHEKLMREIQKHLQEHIQMQIKIMQEEKERAIKEEKERMEQNMRDVMGQKPKSLFQKIARWFY